MMNRRGDQRTEKRRVLDRFRETVKHQRSMKVIVLGTAGVGKSSFLNTVMTSFSDTPYWIERASVGNYQDIGRQETYHLNSFSKANYITRGNQESFAYPIFLDIVGLEDEDSLVIQEMLRVVLFGRLHEGESLQTLHRFISENVENIDAVRERYLMEAEIHRVDRIIFIASAHVDTNIPIRLINAVTSAANSQEMVIPRYGVLTHCDLVDVEDEAFLRKERDFKARLGLPDNRYMRCRNYCDDIDRIYGTNRLEETIPEIDIPVIKFMTQVADSQVQESDIILYRRDNDTIDTVVCQPGFVSPPINAMYHRRNERQMLTKICDTLKLTTDEGRIDPIKAIFAVVVAVLVWIIYLVFLSFLR